MLPEVTPVRLSHRQGMPNTANMRTCNVTATLVGVKCDYSGIGITRISLSLTLMDEEQHGRRVLRSIAFRLITDAVSVNLLKNCER
jgi:hypothetical protein